MNNIKIDYYYKPESKTLRLDEVDYTTTPNSDIKSLLDKSQQENKVLKDNAEHNAKVVDKVNWENQLLKKKNQQLQERIEYLERSNNRREDTIFEQSQKINDLEDNWDMLKDFIDTLWLDNKGIVTKIKDKIKFIEQGDGSNVKD